MIGAPDIEALVEEQNRVAAASTMRMGSDRRIGKTQQLASVVIRATMLGPVYFRESRIGVDRRIKHPGTEG